MTSYRAKKAELKEIKDKIDKLRGVDDLASNIEAMSKCLGWVCVWQARSELEAMSQEGGGEEEGEGYGEKLGRVQERLRVANEALLRAVEEEKEQVEAMMATHANVKVGVKKGESYRGLKPSPSPSLSLPLSLPPSLSLSLSLPLSLSLSLPLSLPLRKTYSYTLLF